MTDRPATRWHRVNAASFMSEMAGNGTLTLEGRPRPDVQTRQWWTLQWTADDGRVVCTVEASSLTLLFKRAVAMEMEVEEHQERAEEEANG